jgi:multidrug efflux pump subunit AcrB
MDLATYEGQLGEGQRALIEVDLRLSPPSWAISGLEDQLKARGIPDVSVNSASPMVQIHFRKGFPWLAIIAAVILATIVLAVLIVGWRLFREVIGTLPLSMQGLAVGLIIIVVLIVAGAFSQARR